MSYATSKIKGLAFLFFTVICWVGSAALIKIIFISVHYNKPFFMTYLADGLMSLYALVLLRNCCGKTSDAGRAEGQSKRYIKLGMLFAPCLFISNFLYSEGLLYTSIASSEVISNSSFIYIFLLSMPVLGMKFSWVKLFSITGSFGGIILVQLVDSKTKSQNPNERPLLGNTISLISSMMYACYAVCLKKFIPEDEKFNWFGFFGVVGITVLVAFFPVIFILDACGVEKFEAPSPSTWVYLLVNAVFGTVLSNYTWGRSVVLLNPLISELGIGLTMPLGFIVDYFLTNKRYNAFYLLGSGYIMSGFAIVTVFDYFAGKEEEKRKEELIEEIDIVPEKDTLAIMPNGETNIFKKY